MLNSNREEIGIHYNINKEDIEKEIFIQESDTTIFDQKIELATEGLELAAHG